MKHRAIVLALASASALLPAGAHAAEDFCSRLIIQAINQFCQLLPNGSTLCQPVALVGPSAECKVPERQGVVQVPLGPPTIQPLAPWAAAHGYPGLPTRPATATAPMSPFVTAPTAPALPAAPAAVMMEAAKPVAEPTAAAGVGTSVAQTSAPTVAAPAAPVAASTPTPPVAPPELPAPPVAAPLTAAVIATPAPVEALAPTVTAPIVAAVATSAAPVAVPPTPPDVERAAVAPPEAMAKSATEPKTPAPDAAPVVTPTTAAAMPTEADKAVDALAHFDFDSANLTDAGRAVLDAWLAEAPKDKTIRVSGHADRLGPDPYNLKLSLRRADAVKQYLIGKGLNPRRIELEARGESDPVKRCKGDPTPATKDCLAPNRRVMIVPE